MVTYVIRAWKRSTGLTYDQSRTQSHAFEADNLERAVCGLYPSSELFSPTDGIFKERRPECINCHRRMAA